MIWRYLLVSSILTLSVACGDDGAGGDDEPRALPATACAPACEPGGPPAPPGYDGDSVCYDGCNWCWCTTAGPVSCTAQEYVGDAGPGMR